MRYLRYYFHIHVVDGASEVDDVDTDFPSEAVAVNEERDLARDIMAEAVRAASKLKRLVRAR